MAFSALEPVEKREPTRYILKPRMLLLAPILKGAAARQWSIVAPRWRKSLASNPVGLRDFVGEGFLL
jgi:hypothetical protein